MKGMNPGTPVARTRCAEERVLQDSGGGTEADIEPSPTRAGTLPAVSRSFVSTHSVLESLLLGTKGDDPRICLIIMGLIGWVMGGTRSWHPVSEEHPASAHHFLTGRDRVLERPHPPPPEGLLPHRILETEALVI